ncbi:MAG: tetratricopeptide repeat protein, partial [Acidobacteriaceae bacterium]
MRRLALASLLLGGLPLGTAQTAAIRQASQAFREGTEAYQRGDLSTARTQFSLAVRLAPGIEEGHSALGVVLCSLGDYPHAIAELNTALKLKPQDRTAEENLAQAYSQSGSDREAIAVFEKMDGQAPLHADLLVAWARALAAIPRTTDAIAIMKRAVEADPRNAMMEDQLGSLDAQASRWPDAEAAFNKAIELNGQLASAHMHLAVVLS